MVIDSHPERSLVRERWWRKIEAHDLWWRWWQANAMRELHAGGGARCTRDDIARGAAARDISLSHGTVRAARDIGGRATGHEPPDVGREPGRSARVSSRAARRRRLLEVMDSHSIRL